MITEPREYLPPDKEINMYLETKTPETQKLILILQSEEDMKNKCYAAARLIATEEDNFCMRFIVYHLRGKLQILAAQKIFLRYQNDQTNFEKNYRDLEFIILRASDDEILMEAWKLLLKYFLSDLTHEILKRIQEKCELKRVRELAEVQDFFLRHPD